MPLTEYLKKALEEFPEDSTYLDIFKKNAQGIDGKDNRNSQRIREVIYNASQMAKTRNLYPGAPDPTVETAEESFAVNDENINDYAIFRGDASVDYIMNSQDKTEYITTTEHRPDLSGTKVHYHTYSGEIYIEMDEPVTAMLPGMYRSNIYVHVVASDDVK